MHVMACIMIFMNLLAVHERFIPLFSPCTRCINHVEHQSTYYCKMMMRTYQEVLSQQEVQDITYIVHMLGTKSYYTILKNKSALEAAGERIQHVHPLVFIKTIATDGNLRGDFYRIKKHYLTWQHFSKGLYASLATEMRNQNITDEHIADFVSQVGKDFSMVKQLLSEHRWFDFIQYVV